MANRVPKNISDVEYPKNLFCDITGYEPDDINIPKNDILLKNINMALEVFKDDNKHKASRIMMLKAVEMRYKYKMSMREIGASINRSGGCVGQYINKFLRRITHPRYIHIVRKGELNPNYSYSYGEESIIDPDSIEELNLSTRAYNCLSRCCIKTITELCSKSEAYILAIETAGPVVLNEIKEKLASINRSLAPFNYSVLMIDINDLGLDDNLYRKLKADGFNTIGSLIKYKRRIISSYDYYERSKIEDALEAKGLLLNIKIPTQTVKNDLLNELIYGLDYEDACKLLLQIRTLSNSK